MKILFHKIKIFKEKGLANDMKTHDLIEFIVNNPSVLKRPIIVTDYEICWYNDDDIELFYRRRLGTGIASIVLKSMARRRMQLCKEYKVLK